MQSVESQDSAEKETSVKAAALAFTSVSCSSYSSTLKMEVICSSKTSVNFQRTTWRYIAEDSTLPNHRYA
jgi:hypothetical protein